MRPCVTFNEKSQSGAQPAERRPLWGDQSHRQHGRSGTNRAGGEDVKVGHEDCSEGTCSCCFEPILAFIPKRSTIHTFRSCLLVLGQNRRKKLPFRHFPITLFKGAYPKKTTVIIGIHYGRFIHRFRNFTVVLEKIDLRPIKPGPCRCYHLERKEGRAGGPSILEGHQTMSF